MTLQDKYRLIKEGKSTEKDVFLKEAKYLYPNFLTNDMGFDAATLILKQKSVINENYIDIKPFDNYETKKKEGWELKYEKFLAEDKKKADAKTKAESKKIDKSVEDKQANGYNRKDYKNADNVIWDQLQRGIYTELSEDPNQEYDKVKDIVLKNLAKDPIYYTKNSAFGIKNIGYTDELPGAKLSKTDQMTALSKEKIKANVKDTLGKKEAAKGIHKNIKKTLTMTPKNSKGVKKMDMPGKEKIIKLKENLKEINFRDLDNIAIELINYAGGEIKDIFDGPKEYQEFFDKKNIDPKDRENIYTKALELSQEGAVDEIGINELLKETSTNPWKGYDDKEESGLMVFASDAESEEKLFNFIDNSDYYGEYHKEGQYFFFPEEEDSYDALEKELEKEFIKLGISVRFEGIWSDSLDEIGLDELLKESSPINSRLKETIGTMIKEGPLKDQIASKKKEVDTLNQQTAQKKLDLANLEKQDASAQSKD